MSENPESNYLDGHTHHRLQNRGVEVGGASFEAAVALTELSNVSDDNLELERTKHKRKCYDCQRGTHWRFWLSPSFALRLCQACAKRRGGKYARLILNAIDYGDR